MAISTTLLQHEIPRTVTSVSMFLFYCFDQGASFDVKNKILDADISLTGPYRSSFMVYDVEARVSARTSNREIPGYHITGGLSSLRWRAASSCPRSSIVICCASLVQVQIHTSRSLPPTTGSLSRESVPGRQGTKASLV